MNIDRVNKYLQNGHNHFDGWINNLDALLIASISILQTQNGISGDLFEIGVYKGKSFKLLQLLTSKNEILHGIDEFIFVKKSEVIKNMETYESYSAKFVLYEINTLNIDNIWLSNIIASGVRLLHLDGGHEYHEVNHDLILFSNWVKDIGILIIDDINDREFPGVMLATCNYMFNGNFENQIQFFPFMIGINKLFCCRPHWVKWYQTKLIETNVLTENSRISRLWNQDILIPHCKYSMTNEDILYQLNFPLSSNQTKDINQAKSYAKNVGPNNILKKLGINRK